MSMDAETVTLIFSTADAAKHFIAWFREGTGCDHLMESAEWSGIGLDEANPEILYLGKM